jgi:hypothetical protein
MATLVKGLVVAVAVVLAGIVPAWAADVFPGQWRPGARRERVLDPGQGPVQAVQRVFRHADLGVGSLSNGSIARVACPAFRPFDP